MKNITKHSKERIVERVEGVNATLDAKKVAKQAWISGKTINHFQTNPAFCNYLRRKRNQTNNCTVRVYRDNIFIWKGKKNHHLVTAHPIPERFMREVA